MKNKTKFHCILLLREKLRFCGVPIQEKKKKAAGERRVKNKTERKEGGGE